MVFRIKICGVTTVEDARIAVDAGADAIGLNFFRGSKRFVSADLAAEIAHQIPAGVQRVGVFVNADSDAIHQVAADVGLDLIQLHGDEPPTMLDELSSLRVVRAFRCKAGLTPLRHYLDACTAQPVAILVDAYDPTSYGGTGQTLHWPDLVNSSDLFGELPLILAGGLTPSNVLTAIEVARPDGVDTAGGVEKGQQPRKDPGRCRAFVAAAKQGFRAIG